MRMHLNKSANHVTFINNELLSKFIVSEYTAQAPESSNSFVYKPSMQNDYDSIEPSTISVHQFIFGHSKGNKNGEAIRSVLTVSTSNVSASDSFLAVRNVSSLPCLGAIPSINEYLAASHSSKSSTNNVFVWSTGLPIYISDLSNYTYIYFVTGGDEKICLYFLWPSIGFPNLTYIFFLNAINIVGVIIFTLGIMAVLLILYMYIDTMKHIMKFAPALVKTHSAFVLSVYPVVGIVAYCAIMVPRAHLLAEAMTQGMFMAALYQLFCLFVAYSGGEAELIKRVRPQSLVLKVPPCCCWPCCCLPRLAIDKTNVKRLRLLVLQLPIVQGLVYMVLLIMWAEEESLYQVNYVYMQPVIILSILCGIWGIVMTMTMLEESLSEHNIRGKFFVLQLVLMLAKLQGLLARFAVWRNWLPCKIPITPTVYANLIYNSSMLWEMILLMYVARKLYKRPVIGLPNCKTHSPIQIYPEIPISCQPYGDKNTKVRY